VFYGTEDVALQNVDVMTDVSMPATAFTRYTVAPTATSRSSKWVQSCLAGVFHDTLFLGEVHDPSGKLSEKWDLDAKARSTRRNISSNPLPSSLRGSQLRKVGNPPVTTVLLMFCIYFILFQGEACNLLPHLFQITPDHRREGQELQKEISDFEAEFRVTVEDIWVRPVTDGDAVVPAPDTWQARMEEAEEKKINPIDKVPKPDLSQGKGWKMNLFDME
jgi:elongator complex protein 1